MNNVQLGTEVRTDGWTGYDNLQKIGYQHKASPVRGDHAKTEQHLPMIHIVFGNLRVALWNPLRGQSKALAELSQRVCVPIQSPVLADGGFQQRVDNRCTCGGSDLCGVVQGDVGARRRMGLIN